MDQNNILKIWILQKFEVAQILKKNMNSLITYEKDKYYFNSKNKKIKIEIDIYFIVLNIGDVLINNISKILYFSAKKAKSISKENMDENIEPVIDLVQNILNKFCYRMEEDKLDIFDFFSELLFRIIIEHKLINGNKRMGLVSLVSIMNYLGFYLSWTKNEEKTKIQYEKYYESFLIDIIKQHHAKVSEKELLKYIKKIILKHTVIDISKLFYKHK